MEKNLLHGNNILLRATEPRDVDFIYAMENDSQIWHFGNTLLPYSRYQIEQYVLSTQHDLFSEKQIRLMIELKHEGDEKRTIGAIDLFDYDPQHKRAGIGILILEKDRNKGYACEALELIIAYSFKILQLHQLFCNISADNPVSVKLFEKAGFERCGIKKEWRLQENKWVDELAYQLINPL